MTTHYSPPERRYGTMHEQTKRMTTREVAAHMRKVVRQTAKDGLLPADWTYSVRYRAYTGGCAIDLTVAVPDTLDELRTKFETEHRYRITTFPDLLVGEYEPLAELLRAERLLNEIHGAYNHDGSDVMTDYFDVRYYGTVTFVGQTRYDRFYAAKKKAAK